MQRGDAMNDNGFWGMLVIVMLLAIALGSLLILFGISPTLDWLNGTQSQTLTISNTPTLDNCDAAQSVGDGACNATITELPWGAQAAVLLGGFMVAAGVFNLALIAVVSR